MSAIEPKARPLLLRESDPVDACERHAHARSQVDIASNPQTSDRDPRPLPFRACQILCDQDQRLARHPHDPDAGGGQAGREFVRKSDYRVERNLSDRMQLRLNEVWGEDKVGGIDVGHPLGISRSLVQRTTDVFGAADERLTSMVMPMPELMTGAE